MIATHVSLHNADVFTSKVAVFAPKMKLRASNRREDLHTGEEPFIGDRKT